MAKHVESERGNVLRAPGIFDRRWEEKAALAVKARESASAARAGKPASFRPAVGFTTK